MNSWKEEVTDEIMRESTKVDRCWLCQYLHVVYDDTNGPYMFYCDFDKDQDEEEAFPARKACDKFKRSNQHLNKWGPLRIDTLEEYNREELND